jgi:hypothetical protein
VTRAAELLGELAMRGTALADEIDHASNPDDHDVLIYYPTKVTVWAVEVRAVLARYPDRLAEFDASLEEWPPLRRYGKLGDVADALRQYRERLDALLRSWTD